MSLEFFLGGSIICLDMKAKKEENVRTEKVYKEKYILYIPTTNGLHIIGDVTSFYPRSKLEGKNLSPYFIWEVIPRSTGSSREGKRKTKGRKLIKDELSCRSPLWAAGLKPQGNSGKPCRRYLRVACPLPPSGR